jgi:D-alanine-D-alanine ligase-like ATP-grasp enzyme
MTGPGEKLLEGQGLEIDSIPKAEEIVWLSRTSNMHQGTEIADVTDTMHPPYTEVNKPCKNSPA